MWIKETAAGLEDIYGRQRGGDIARTILPSIYADYKKMILAARSGEIVEESYETEDKKAVISLKGRRDSGEGSLTLLSVSVNGRQMKLEEDEKIQ